MAAMNWQGAILASRGILREEEMEEDNNLVTNEKSTIIFKHFKY